jgi:DNA-binding transcriptional regulator YdaS (Cro superfamily)
MKNITLGKYNQRLGPLNQNINSRSQRPQVGSLTIDTKTATALQRHALKPTALGKDLPSGHRVKRQSQALGRFQKTIRIPVEGMVGCDEYPKALPASLGQMV